VGERFVTLTTNEGLPENRIRALLQDSAGTLWVGTFGGGVCRYDGRFTCLDTRNGLASNMVVTLRQDARGALWIGPMRRHQPAGRWPLHTYTTREGLFDNTVHSTIEDGQGFVWISCNKGCSDPRSRIRRARSPRHHQAALRALSDDGRHAQRRSE